MQAALSFTLITVIRIFVFISFFFFFSPFQPGCIWIVLDFVRRAEVTVFAYEPLRGVEPLFSLVTLASSTEYQVFYLFLCCVQNLIWCWKFEGGPAPWYLDTSLHYLQASTEEVCIKHV